MYKKRLKKTVRSGSPTDSLGYHRPLSGAWASSPAFPSS